MGGRRNLELDVDNFDATRMNTAPGSCPVLAALRRRAITPAAAASRAARGYVSTNDDGLVRRPSSRSSDMLGENPGATARTHDSWTWLSPAVPLRLTLLTDQLSRDDS
jgi:hypothetical protein